VWRERGLGVKAVSNEPPMVSVVIPCFNEEKIIQETLRYALNQDYEGHIEIIVVDDGSTDNTNELARKFVETNEMANREIRIVTKENGGKPSALNAGFERARGVYCVSSDGDTYLAENAVRLIVEKFMEDERTGIVAGMVHVKNRDKLFTKLQEIEYIYGQLQFRLLQSDGGNVLIAPGCIFGIRTELAKKHPSTEETCVEDFDTTIAVKTSGWKTVQEPRAKAFTEAPGTLRAWWNQRKRWWYGIFQVWRKHKTKLTRFSWFLFFYPFGYLLALINLITWLLFPAFLMASPSIVYSSLFYVQYLSIVLAVSFLKLAFFLVDSGNPKLIAYLPAYLLYDLLCTFASAYLYVRYLLGFGVSFRYGRRQIHVK